MKKISAQQVRVIIEDLRREAERRRRAKEADAKEEPMARGVLEAHIKELK
jgi:hypothetical protein